MKPNQSTFWIDDANLEKTKFKIKNDQVIKKPPLKTLIDTKHKSQKITKK